MTAIVTLNVTLTYLCFLQNLIHLGNEEVMKTRMACLESFTQRKLTF